MACAPVQSFAFQSLFQISMPSHTLIALGLTACSLLAMPALAQSAAPPAMAAPTSAKRVAMPGLYQALGEKPGISRLMDDFVARLFKDPRIGDQFKETKPEALQESLTEQICQLSGGPCVYEGTDMQSVHADMDINKGHFNALVEVLQVAMDAQSIPFVQQNRLLALLAPMHRDIITVR